MKYGSTGFTPAAPAGDATVRVGDSASYVYQIGNTITNVTAATKTLTTADAGVVTLNRAAGIAVTLPAASGTGVRYEIIVGTTITSNSTTVKAANASDSYVGNVVTLADGGSSVVGWEVVANDDTLTLNGSTTGGIKGDKYVFQDIAANTWLVSGVAAGTGTEATPFSATVS